MHNNYEIYKKFENIVNNAMRSSMDFDSPAEEIQEFIKYLGQNIGAERFYVFEDIDENYVSNTYEWCAPGVIPAIDFLKNFDKGIIDWWYAAFEKGESIIINDTTELKFSNPEAYNVLHRQNIKSLIVSPMIIKSKVIGFFGIDNPTEMLDELKILLEMIGSFMVSLIKLQKSFDANEEKAKFNMLSSLSKIYYSMHFVDVKKGTSKPIKSIYIEERLIAQQSRMDFIKYIEGIMRERVNKDYIDEVLEFLKLSDLAARMKDKDKVSHVFLSDYLGWCRQSFIAVDRENGEIAHVLYTTEVIDEEKRHSDRLIYLSENDTMTGIKNRGCGEHMIKDLISQNVGGLFFIFDCDSFKKINDTYGHAIGDEVLISVADAMRKSIKDEGSILHRLGGDEFAVYVPECTCQETAVPIITALFDKINDISISDYPEIKPNISLGAAFFRDRQCMDFEALYKLADKAMYKSKGIPGNSYTFAN